MTKKGKIALLLVFVLLGAGIVMLKVTGIGFRIPAIKTGSSGSVLSKTGSSKAGSGNPSGSQTADESSSGSDDASGSSSSSHSSTAGKSSSGLCLLKKAAGSNSGPEKDARSWRSLGRLHYTEGIIQSFQKSAKGTGTLSLKITQNYHSGTDPVDDPNTPFPLGTTKDFVLQQFSETRLKKGTDVVIYGCDVSSESDPNRQFSGAAVMYYKKDGDFVDSTGKAAGMPPRDYPQFKDVFQ